jgi:hypothetical protein
VKLYHFTAFWNLRNVGEDNILAAGLRPGVSTEYWPLDGIPPCVWLTANGDDRFFERAPECRITVVIPTRDRRLVSWPKYLRKAVGAADFEKMTQAQDRERNAVGQVITWRQWWMYFGTVPLSMFTVVDCADPVRRAEAAGQGRLWTPGEPI